jgi:flagellar biogenesis protein FliO
VTNASLAVVLLRLVLAVAVVVGLLLLTARLTRRVGERKTASGRDVITVAARQPLSRSASIAVVHAAGRTLVVGITDGQVTLLSDQDGPTATTPAEPIDLSTLTPAGARRSMLTALRDRTVRKP